MSTERSDLVRLDPTGTAHPVGRLASQWMRGRQGLFQLMPSPRHLVFMRAVGEDGTRQASLGPLCRLSGEIAGPGSLCDIVSLIGQAGWRGELVVATESAVRSVYFEHGVVICGVSNAESERLGEVLYRYGVLSRAQVEAAVKAVTPELRFGEASVKLGFVQREQLFSLMARQTEEVFYAMLLISEGAFFFLDDFDSGRLPAHLTLSVSALLMEGVRRMDETRYFRERIPSDLHVPTRVAAKGEPKDDGLKKIWAHIDGQKSIAELCRAVRQGEFEVTHAVFQLLQGGYVTVAPPRPSGPAAAVARFNEALSLLFDAVDALGKGTPLREQLAAFASGTGVYDALYMGAGPKADGTFDVERMVDNVAMLVGPGPAGETMLSQWLHEYASFAAFTADPVLRNSEHHVGVAAKIGALLAPLAPRS